MVIYILNSFVYVYKMQTMDGEYNRQRYFTYFIVCYGIVDFSTVKYATRWTFASRTVATAFLKVAAPIGTKEPMKSVSARLIDVRQNQNIQLYPSQSEMQRDEFLRIFLRLCEFA